MAEPSSPQGALRGVEVVEFGHYIPGPLLGMLLADQGASVVKVERPAGDPARSEPAFATWNRGKRSVVLDLKTAEGLEQALALVSSADVLIENFRPGVMERLGLGYDVASHLNPGIVYCSLPGFDEANPHRHEQGWDSVVAAATAVHRPLGRAGAGDPIFMPLPLPSTLAAILASVSVTGALYARGRSGRGQRVEVPLYSAMFTTMARDIVLFHDSKKIDPRFLAILPMSAHYRCADGRYLQLHGTFERFVRAFLTVGGRPEWADEAVDFLHHPGDHEKAELWQERFTRILSERSAAEWEDAIAAAGGAGCVARSTDEWLAHPHARAAGHVIEIDDAVHGRMKQPGITVNLRGTPGAVSSRAPKLGEHNRVVLPVAPRATPKAVSRAQPEIDLKAAFGGVRVLDLCIILAGPTCGRTMAEFGADVVKIDDPRRPYNIFASVDVNRGKRSMILDLKKEEGRRIFWQLAETADVVVENFRKGKMAELGLGYEDVRKRRPDIIYASLNGYGHDGPWAERAGWEQLAQAAAGMQVRRGGRNAEPKVMPYPVDDYGNGLISAYGVALALLERQRTGRGQCVDSNLTSVASLFQSPYFLDFAGYRRNDPEGIDIRGFSALSRLYRGSDGAWLFIHLPDDAAWDRLTALPDFEPLKASGVRGNDADLTAALQAIFARRKRDDWVAELRKAGLSIIENRRFQEILEDPEVRRAGLIVTRDHPGIGSVDHTGRTASLSRTPTTLGRPSPILGADTDAILAELDYTQAEIEALVAKGVVRRADLTLVE